MYSWIWRKLPFGLGGKLAGSLALVVGALMLLWYVVFPALEPLLPFDDSQIVDENGNVVTDFPEYGPPTSINPKDYETEASPTGSTSNGEN